MEVQKDDYSQGRRRPIFLFLSNQLAYVSHLYELICHISLAFVSHLLDWLYPTTSDEIMQIITLFMLNPVVHC